MGNTHPGTTQQENIISQHISKLLGYIYHSSNKIAHIFSSNFSHNKIALRYSERRRIWEPREGKRYGV
jgi:hypothetical protein